MEKPLIDYRRYDQFVPATSLNDQTIIELAQGIGLIGQAGANYIA